MTLELRNRTLGCRERFGEGKVSASSEMNYALRMLQYMRAGARVNSRVAVEVEWKEGGSTHRAAGHTIDISPKGCLAIVPQDSRWDRSCG